ncbi:hypothetical protein Syun_016304 [Stephania yunnanensis]|uniref:Uncharacterized protein n=1 Tax=Stephania yunnanensis TaxID=152371 RepID=A0AAP0P188_9MAGN
MKTDPQNSDYVVESGATRNFEPWRAEDEELDIEKRKREDEEMGDAMKSLENRTSDSKREMDVLAALDEMKSMKSRHATVSVDAMLEVLQRTAEEKEKKLEEEDEALIKLHFLGARRVIKRLHDEDDDEDGDSDTNNLQKRNTSYSYAHYCSQDHDLDRSDVTDTTKNHKVVFQSPAIKVSVVKREVRSGEISKAGEQKKQDGELNASSSSAGLQSLMQNYDTDESVAETSMEPKRCSSGNFCSVVQLLEDDHSYAAVAMDFSIVPNLGFAYWISTHFHIPIIITSEI